MSIIDISLPLSQGIPTWPGSTGFCLVWEKRLENGDECNNSKFISDVHTGTHLDAPLHFFSGGQTVDQLDPNRLIGHAVVVDLPEITEISAITLRKLKLPSHTTRLLFRTRNSRWWASGDFNFHEDFTALTPDAAKWLVEKGLCLVGVDYLSIEKFHGSHAVHRILLSAGLVVLEGLNLCEVEPGEYELICLPMKILGAEGAPARAILRSINQEG
ncbi:cyclase family protein [Thermodesulfobacteriota bacterium]